MIIVPIILGSVVLILLILAAIQAGRIISEHGPLTVIMRWVIGRHHAHTHHERHTNATFWKASNGKVIGRPAGRVLKRHHRAGWVNLSRSALWLTGFAFVVYGAITARLFTTVAVGLFILTILGMKVVASIKAARTAYDNRLVVRPLARAIAGIPGTSESDMESNIQLRPDYALIRRGEVGRIYFPDTFRALPMEQESVNDVVVRRMPMDVDVSWHPPRKGELQYARIVAAPPLPKLVRFEDCLDDILKLKPRDYIAGYDRNGKAKILSHNGDKPMKAFSMDSGTGKSTTLRSIIAQIKTTTPNAWIYVFDTKQVSLECFRGIPRVIIHSDPSAMGDMWKEWANLRQIVRDRYTAFKADPSIAESFDPIFIILEEGNDFSVQIKAYWQNELRPTLTDPAMRKLSNPPIWFDIANILWQGREVNVFNISVLQNFMEKYFGGISLRPAFGTMGMAGYKPSQWRTIIGTTPVPVRQDGQGRICIVEGREETWIQSMFAEKEWFTEYVRKVTENVRWDSNNPGTPNTSVPAIDDTDHVIDGKVMERKGS